MIRSIVDVNDGPQLASDVCIVGAGPVGISLALRMCGKGLKVAVLVGGGRDETEVDQGLYAGEVADAALHSPTDQYRHRGLGGSTSTWGGRCVKFDEIDFEARSWIPESGWPISSKDVEPYYAEALRLAEAGDDDFNPATAISGGMREMVAGWASQDFSQDSVERFSCPTNFGERWAGLLAECPDLQVYLDAHATEIVTTADGKRVENVRVRTHSGKTFTFSANTFILACGGIETPRLMVCSRKFDSKGIGNANDIVGRYYMCHIAGSSGQVEFEIPSSKLYHGYERTWDGVYVRRRIRLRDEAQRALRVGNVVLRLHHPRLPDPSHGHGVLSLIYLAKSFIGYEYAKRLTSDNGVTWAMWIKHVFNVVRDAPTVLTFLVFWLRKRTLAPRKFPSLVVAPKKGVYSIEVHAEQAPYRDSRITLSEQIDPFGMPRVKVDWRWSPLDIETVQTVLQALQQDFETNKIGRVTFDAAAVERDMLRDGAFGGHHIGTTRMSSDPHSGVVDSDCRVHGVENLYIAGSAVFPTSGQANPTLLAIALALRLGDHITGMKSGLNQQESAFEVQA